MSETVRIGVREFRVGAIYRPKSARSRSKPRKFCGNHDWLGWVHYLPEGSVKPRPITAGGWVRWAGEEVAP